MFGLKGVVSEYSAKEVVLPPDSQKESEQNRQLYIRSHGNYEAGEQNEEITTGVLIQFSIGLENRKKKFKIK